jgi:hypothetical protein
MTWDEQELARAFKVTVADVREYLTDGRRVSFIIERRLKWGSCSPPFGKITLDTVTAESIHGRA